jgi:hypothetical protein
MVSVRNHAHIHTIAPACKLHFIQLPILSGPILHCSCTSSAVIIKLLSTRVVTFMSIVLWLTEFIELGAKALSYYSYR